MTGFQEVALPQLLFSAGRTQHHRYKGANPMRSSFHLPSLTPVQSCESIQNLSRFCI